MIDINRLNKLFESRVKLGIMAVLTVNEEVDFNTLKQLLDVTDGNLATHLRALENAGYLRAEKNFVGRKPNTKYSVTETGRRSFREHLDALEELIG